MATPYVIRGHNSSPYSMKMRAIMRYRRIPHRWDQQSPAADPETADIHPRLMPMVRFPDSGEWRVDSTPLALALEEAESGRSILPPDPARRFLAQLIEDMADEWLTKAMYHYRWRNPADREWASWWIACDHIPIGPDAEAARRAMAEQITARQVGRMALVGAMTENRPVIEESLHRVLRALEGRVGYGSFLFGGRPSLADFGLFGQLKTMAEDPTSRALIMAEAPITMHWIRHMDDLSGLEGDWASAEAPLSEAVRDLLGLCGAAYLPFLATNAKAEAERQDAVGLTIFNHPYVQAPFRYQSKCLARLLALYAELPAADRALLAPVLTESDCLRWLDPA